MFPAFKMKPNFRSKISLDLCVSHYLIFTSLSLSNFNKFDFIDRNCCCITTIWFVTNLSIQISFVTHIVANTYTVSYEPILYPFFPNQCQIKCNKCKFSDYNSLRIKEQTIFRKKKEFRPIHTLPKTGNSKISFHFKRACFFPYENSIKLLFCI